MTNRRLSRCFRWAAFVGVVLVFGGGTETTSAADNLVYVTWDGFRWQELFSGADERFFNKESGGVPNVDELRRTFWRDTPEARREVLLPFIWSVVARQGQIFGDPSRQAAMKVTNGKNFSYPGYNEMFVGFPDERVNSNDKIPNANINVLEHLNRRPQFAGRVSAFATWDVVDFILNRERSRLLVQTGWTPLNDEPLTSREMRVNEMISELPRLWRGNAYDVIAFQSAREHLQKRKPRVLYLGLGETDEWAHARRYDLYLEAAQRSDRYLSELWELLQSMPQYKDRTALVISTDHGRGGTGKDWTNHSADTPGAEFIWAGLMGQGIPKLGVRENVATTQSQIAATLAALVGENFESTSSQIAPPLPLE